MIFSLSAVRRLSVPAATLPSKQKIYLSRNVSKPPGSTESLHSRASRYFFPHPSCVGFGKKLDDLALLSCQVAECSGCHKAKQTHNLSQHESFLTPPSIIFQMKLPFRVNPFNPYNSWSILEHAICGLFIV